MIPVQNMSSVLMLAIEKAASPTEATESLLTLQAMLVGDSAAQVRDDSHEQR
jgi:hypothetical protein